MAVDILPFRSGIRCCFFFTIVVALAPPAAPGPPLQVDSNPTLTFSRFSAGAPLHMVAYGDMRFTDPSVTKGTTPRVRQWLAQRVARENPQVLLLTGDMPFTGASPVDWQDFQNETASWRSQNILQLPTTGNHEAYGGRDQGMANYRANFPDIDGHLYYSALLGSVEVISLDCTADPRETATQERWFATQLDHLPEQAEFLMILYHMPWLADRQSQLFVHLPTPEANILHNILETRQSHIQAKVLVLNGHIHNYERFERRGVEYVVTGGGGAEPYPLLFRGRGDLYRDLGFPVFHYLTIEIGNHQLHAVMWKVKDPDAATLEVEAKDEFTLTSTAAQPQPKAPKRKRGVSHKPNSQ